MFRCHLSELTGHSSFSSRTSSSQTRSITSQPAEKKMSIIIIIMAVMSGTLFPSKSSTRYSSHPCCRKCPSVSARLFITKEWKDSTGAESVSWTKRECWEEWWCHHILQPKHITPWVRDFGQLCDDDEFTSRSSVWKNHLMSSWRSWLKRTSFSVNRRLNPISVRG